MILLYGIEEDLPMSMVRSELEKQGGDFYFLNHREIFRSSIEYHHSRRNPSRVIIRSGNDSVDFSTIKAVYLRPYNFMDYPDAEGKPADDPVVAAAAGFEYQFMSVMDSSDAMVINKTEPSASNNCKPFQLNAIVEAGLLIPETLITNDPNIARKFLKKTPDSIYKSISGVRSIVQKVSEHHHSYIGDVKWCPTLFQKVVPGINYRVHVVQNDVFTVRIESDKLDYRYGNTTMMAEELPREIAQKCRKLTASLGLHFSGIDLMRTPDDQWYCFEVNPSPAYSYFEINGKVPICASLARHLILADQA
jgi:glutathione synthase/RimK-type ligase-like ATP-grasp enzyme